MSDTTNNGHPADLGAAIDRAVNELHAKYESLDDGRLADYIPELAKADPDAFAIAFATTTGEVYEAGDSRTAFTMQSISKPFVYGAALERHGRTRVLAHVGVEPTGDAFNAIIKMDAANRPHNPCVNAGAIATTGLIDTGDPAQSLNDILAMFSRYLAEPARVDMAVFTSERSTGHRNRAIAHLLHNFGMIDANVEQILDLYFQQCSINVTTRALAITAATLANGGVNPITNQRAVDAQYHRDNHTVNYTSGKYDYAGEWAYTVGLPAKSGISGGTLAVVPGVGGFAVYSPRLDDRGHSVRGIKVCEDLSCQFGMHMFDACLSADARLSRSMFVRREEPETDLIDPVTTDGATQYEPDRGRAPEPGPESADD